jgi:hypothetical protein
MTFVSRSQTSGPDPAIELRRRVTNSFFCPAYSCTPGASRARTRRSVDMSSVRSIWRTGPAFDIVCRSRTGKSFERVVPVRDSQTRTNNGRSSRQSIFHSTKTPFYPPHRQRRDFHGKLYDYRPFCVSQKRSPISVQHAVVPYQPVFQSVTPRNGMHSFLRPRAAHLPTSAQSARANPPDRSPRISSANRNCPAAEPPRHTEHEVQT